jgi:hypothetical protein
VGSPDHASRDAADRTLIQSKQVFLRCVEIRFKDRS